jgi:hypothetical protein
MSPPDVRDDIHPDAQNRRAAVAVWAIGLLVTATLVLYACTEAFAWDEGYHLVAAWLIAHGKTPYLDFLFPQTPLNAYWNAMLLRAIGEYWQVPHTAAALLTCAAAGLASGYVYRRLPAPPAWRTSAAILTMVTIVFNTAVFEFGSLQAYGMCLFLILLAYLATIRAVGLPGLWLPCAAGLLSGAAASSSLLTAPVAPVLLAWMLVVNRSGNRVKKFAVFAAGALAAQVPLLLLLIKSPRQVVFGFLQYELIFRKVEWDDALTHNLGEVLGLADSSQAVIVVLLAAAGILFMRRNSWSPFLKAEFYLCGWMALALTLHLLTARPTFSRYFLLTVPFLAILAAAGVFELCQRLGDSAPRPWVAAAILCIVTAYGLAASVFEQRDDFMWSDAEEAAAKVHEVTPPSASLLADEPVYFLLHRTPPSGMELEDSHKLVLSNTDAATFHVVPRPKLDLMIKAGRFDTVEMCDDDEIDRLDLSSLYKQNAAAGSCKVFWNWGTATTK